MSVFAEVAVGESPGQVSLTEAGSIAQAAQDAGATGLLLVDAVDGRPAVDPAVVGSYLAARYDTLTYLIEAPTTHNAPYNLARRVLSFDRATGGRVGLLLRPGVGDEVSDAAAPGTPGYAEERWAEYAEVVGRLWESFPAAALRGDQAAAVVAEDTLIRPIDHDGPFYRVAGPLDGPSSAQGRPVLVAIDPEALGWDRVALIADAVVVRESGSGGAAAALIEATERAGRSRREIALLSRVSTAIPGAVLPGWASDRSLDGIVLAATGDPVAVVERIRDVVPRFTRATAGTLRSALGLRTVAEVLR